MKATLVFLARDRTTVMQHMAAGLKGTNGIQAPEFYDAVWTVPLHEADDYNILLAEIEAVCMRGGNESLPRAMVPGDVVVFEGGPVFLADVADRWTELGPPESEIFRKIATAKENSCPG